MKLITISLITLTLSSCATRIPLTKGSYNQVGGASVYILNPNMQFCKFIKDIDIHFLFARKNAINITNKFKNEVSLAGGNTGQPTEISTFSPFLKGKAFNCKKEFLSKYANQLN